MKKAVAIRHVAFEDLGTFERVLTDAGYEIEYVDAPLDQLARINPGEPQLLIVLGGPIGAYEEDTYPFLRDELRLIEARLAMDRPVLGVCLGAQLMARALGARVYPGSQKEIGWAPVTLTGAGRESPLAPLAKGAPVLHWHGDTFDLPHGAQCLASTRLYQNQAFAWGACALGLQFHLEADAATLEAWFVGHAAEIAATAGVTVEKLRDDTKRYAPAVADVADDILSSWLRGVRYTPAVRYSS